MKLIKLKFIFSVIFILITLAVSQQVLFNEVQEYKKLEFYVVAAIRTVINQPTLSETQVINGPYKECVPNTWSDASKSKTDENRSFTYIQAKLSLFNRLLNKKFKVNGKKYTMLKATARICKDKKTLLEALTVPPTVDKSDQLRRQFVYKGEVKVDDEINKKLILKVKPKLEELSEFYHNLFKTPMVAKFESCLKCMHKKLKLVDKEKAKHIVNFLLNAKKIKKGDFKSSMNTLIEPFCNYKKFKGIIKRLYKTLNNPIGEPEKEWSKIGSFVGETINQLAITIEQ